MVQGSVRGGCQLEFSGLLGNKVQSPRVAQCLLERCHIQVSTQLSAEQDSVSALTCLCCGEALGPTPNCHFSAWGARCRQGQHRGDRGGTICEG